MGTSLANRNTVPAIRFVGGFSAEYQAVYDLFTTKPSAAVAAADNAMIKALVDAGLWSTKLDIFDVLAAHINSDGESLKNWISPGTFDPTLVNAPAFVSLEGFTGNGSTSYIRTNWIPSTNAINFARNDASTGAYIRNNVAGDLTAFGVLGNNNTFIILNPRTGGGNAIYSINSAAFETDANTDSRGMSIIRRDDSANHEVFRNKVEIGTGPDASAAIPDLELFGLAYNNQGVLGNPSTHQLSLLFAGAGLTQADINIITDAFETRMDTLGKGIIP